MLCEVADQVQNCDFDKAKFLFFNGFVEYIKNDDKIYYNACPNDNCRKKVIEENGIFRCEKCEMNYDASKPTYMFKAKISDFTSSIWVNFSKEQGETLLGMPATEFKQFKEANSHEDVTAYLDSLKFK